MQYSECFYSVQGEGAMTGLPSVFFRTSKCNLRCWWCDTPYTSWEPENKEVTTEEALKMIEDFGCKNVVITGGEPYLWATELRQLCEHLWSGQYHTTIETNATLYKKTRADLISMSPKLESSTPYERDPEWARKHDNYRINYDVMNQFIEDCSGTPQEQDYQLKFVVTQEHDLEEIQDILAGLKSYNPRKVYLMPEGRTKEEVESKEEMLVYTAMAHGFRYSDRMHVRLWGDKRGV